MFMFAMDKKNKQRNPQVSVIIIISYDTTIYRKIYLQCDCTVPQIDILALVVLIVLTDRNS